MSLEFQGWMGGRAVEGTGLEILGPRPKAYQAVTKHPSLLAHCGDSIVSRPFLSRRVLPSWVANSVARSLECSLLPVNRQSDAARRRAKGQRALAIAKRVLDANRSWPPLVRRSRSCVAVH
jgi:hypothetical protein